MRIKNKFTANEASRLAGFKTAYMLDYLFRSGVVRPSVLAEPGRGRKRYYSFDDVLLLKALNILLGQGISVKKLRDAQKSFLKSDLKAKEKKFPFRYMVTDGVDIFYVDDADGIINLSKGGQRAFAFFLDMEPITNELYNEALRLTA